MLLPGTNKVIRFTADRIRDTTITFIVKISLFTLSIYPEASSLLFVTNLSLCELLLMLTALQRPLGHNGAGPPLRHTDVLPIGLRQSSPSIRKYFT